MGDNSLVYQKRYPIEISSKEMTRFRTEMKLPRSDVSSGDRI